MDVSHLHYRVCGQTAPPMACERDTHHEEGVRGTEAHNEDTAYHPPHDTTCHLRPCGLGLETGAAVGTNVNAARVQVLVSDPDLADYSTSSPIPIHTTSTVTFEAVKEGLRYWSRGVLSENSPKCGLDLFESSGIEAGQPRLHLLISVLLPFRRCSACRNEMNPLTAFPYEDGMSCTEGMFLNYRCDLVVKRSLKELEYGFLQLIELCKLYQKKQKTARGDFLFLLSLVKLICL